MSLKVFESLALIDIEMRVTELDKNLNLSHEEIFDNICQEYELDADFFAENLNCKCPFALVGFLYGIANPNYFLD